MGNKLRVFIGILLITVGIGLVLYVFKGKIETSRYQDQLYDKFISMDNGDIESELHKKEDSGETEYKYVDMVTPIAYMTIPKINLKVVAAEGTDLSILRYAIGHFEDTVMPGEKGNCAFAGHRNFDTGEFFLKLDRLSEGDDIIIKDHDNTYTYKVTKNLTIAPEDTYILQSENEEDATVTLITCTYDGVNRFVVQGKLDSTVKNKEK